MKWVLCWLICLVLLSPAQAEPEHQHSYTGSHGMVLFAAEQKLLVSHLPLYRPPHDYQLVYQIQLPQASTQSVLATLQRGDMLTVLPQNFDLMLMISAQRFTVQADIYQGHFERGGTPWLTDVTVKFEQQVFKRGLQQPGTDKLNAQYAAFSVANQHFLLHQIMGAPSFDQIIRVSATPAQLNLAAPDAATAISLLQAQGLKVEQLYLETQDFSQ